MIKGPEEQMRAVCWQEVTQRGSILSKREVRNNGFYYFYLTISLKTLMRKPAISVGLLLLGAILVCGCHPDMVRDIDGNEYNVVKIGKQYWMAGNLKSTHYADGTQIPLVEDQSVWKNLKVDEKAYCYYNNDSALGSIYGALYNWAAASNGYKSDDGRRNIQGVCPDGWHLPNDVELKRLEIKLGMSKSEANKKGARGQIAGGKLKEAGIVHWDSPNQGATNESGFAFLPGGYRSPPGKGNIDFNHITSAGFLWSSSTSPLDKTMAFSRMLYFGDSKISRQTSQKSMGLSVRCVRD